MEVYTTKNDWIDVIKGFFISQYKVLVIGLVIVVSTIICWNCWQSYQVDRLQESAQIFEHISHKLQTDSKEALVESERFADETNNVYSVLTYVELTKIAVKKGDFIGAERLLLKALAIAKLDDLKYLLNIRLARVRLALNKTDQAITTLNQVQDTKWNTIVETIRGDILLKKGDIIGAHAAYSKGVKSTGTEMMKTILKIKINSLSN